MVERLQAEKLKVIVSEKNNVDMEVVVHESIDSTNSWSLRQCKAGKVLPFACFAEEQTSGRGRRGKQWVMSANSDIAMSISWPFYISYQQLHLLPLSVAMAIVETLESLNLQQVQIKWPNDVFVRDKKIAGILIETQSINKNSSNVDTGDEKPDSKVEIAVVIGVGLNYDMPLRIQLLADDGARSLADLTDIWREMRLQSVAQPANRVMVASTLLHNVVTVCQRFQQDSKCYLDKFRRQYDYCKNKAIEITLDNKQTLSAYATGVNDEAELMVLVDGNEHTFNSAEVSVKAEKQ
jgi:BirA family biotin operon repressor/biotin-[acetyl-CoA-carboxylase] ligase